MKASTQAVHFVAQCSLFPVWYFCIQWSFRFRIEILWENKSKITTKKSKTILHQPYLVALESQFNKLERMTNSERNTNYSMNVCRGPDSQIDFLDSPHFVGPVLKGAVSPTLHRRHITSHHHPLRRFHRHGAAGSRALDQSKKSYWPSLISCPCTVLHVILQSL